MVQRVFALLNTTNLLSMTTHSEADDELFRETSYRLKNEFVSWKAAVEIHAVFSKAIVLDMTHLSPAVLDEFELMRGPDFWYKTLFLCPTEESRRVVEPLAKEQATALIVRSLEELRSKLLGLKDRFPAAPTPHRDISLLTNVFAQERRGYAKRHRSSWPKPSPLRRGAPVTMLRPVGKRGPSWRTCLIRLSSFRS